MPVDTDRQREEEQEELHGQMSFLDHLEELRKRIIHSLISIGVALGVCWTFADALFRTVARPIYKAGVSSLVVSSPTEGFNLELKLALMAAVFLSAPFVLGQVWLFISLGLYKHERRYALPFIFFSTLLFIIVCLFGYFVDFSLVILYQLY